jgi:hypothetical protein
MTMSEMRLMIASAFYMVTAYAPQILCLMEATKVLEQLGVNYTYTQLCGDSYVDRAKNNLVHEFLKTDYTHLMIIDSDETWDVEGFARLIKAALSGCEIVAGLYPCKNNWEFYGGYPLEKDGAIMGIEKDGMRLIEMDIVPGGFIIYSREAFERTRPNLDSYVNPDNSDLILEAFRCNIEYLGHKIFKREELEDMEVPQLVDIVMQNQRGGRKGGRIGEDIYFQKRYKEMGGKIWCEPDITMGHFGVKEWRGNYHEFLLNTRVRNQENKQEEVSEEAAG